MTAGIEPVCPTMRDGVRPLRETRPFEDAHRPVPEHRPGVGDSGREALARHGTDVEPEPARRNVVVRCDTTLGGRLEGGSGHHVGRQPRVVGKWILLAEQLRHLPADEDRVRALSEALEHADLVVDLRAARDEHEGPLDLAEQPAEHLELTLEQKPGVGGKHVCHALGGGVRPVRRAEGVVDVEVPASGEPGCARGIVLRLAGIEAGVLEHLDPVVGEQLA